MQCAELLRTQPNIVIRNNRKYLSIQLKNCSLGKTHLNMTKHSILLWSTILLFHVGLTQQSNTIIINPTKQNEEELIKRIYQYSGFTKGQAYYRDGNIAYSMLNYNYLTTQIEFIDPKGDTLELIDGNNFVKIVIEADTFCYYNKSFIQQVSHYPTYNLFLKRLLQNNGSEKKGAYDIYSSTTSIGSVNTIVDNRMSTVNLATDENIRYIFKENYYLAGRFGQYYPATKKGALELFGKNEKKLKEFLEKNEINFSKKEDLEKLLEYARTTLK